MTDVDCDGHVMMIADCIYRGDRYQLSAHVPHARLRRRRCRVGLTDEWSGLMTDDARTGRSAPDLRQPRRSLIERLETSQWQHIDAAAELMTEAMARGGTIHAFGSGHSHMFAEELFYRAGGFVRIEPILFEGLMLHASAPLSTALERVPGLAGGHPRRPPHQARRRPAHRVQLGQQRRRHRDGHRGPGSGPAHRRHHQHRTCHLGRRAAAPGTAAARARRRGHRQRRRGRRCRRRGRGPAHARGADLDGRRVPPSPTPWWPRSPSGSWRAASSRKSSAAATWPAAMPSTRAISRRAGDR